MSDQTNEICAGLNFRLDRAKFRFGQFSETIKELPDTGDIDDIRMQKESVVLHINFLKKLINDSRIPFRVGDVVSVPYLLLDKNITVLSKVDRLDYPLVYLEILQDVGNLKAGSIIKSFYKDVQVKN